MKKIVVPFLWLLVLLGTAHAQNNEVKISFIKEGGKESQESFKSSDHFYAMADLAGKSVKDFFKMADISKTNPYGYLYYVMEVYKGTQLLGENSWNFVYIPEVQKKSTTLKLDVLPLPANATSVLSGSPVFDAGLAAAPLYELISKKNFEETGAYTIKIRIYNRTYDAYGSEQPYEKWPTLSGSFTFNFSEDDVAMLLKNGELADAAAAKKAFK